MRVKEAVKKLNQYLKLLEIHEEDKSQLLKFNAFISEIENSGYGLKQLLSLAQAGKYALSEEKQTLIWDLLETGTFSLFDEILQNTPSGILEMMKLSGLGPKKIRTIWKELGVKELEELKIACENKEVSALKGFGLKTEKNILDSVDFLIENKTKLLLPHAQYFSESVIKEIKGYLPDLRIKVVGDLCRHLSVVSSLQLAILKEDKKAVFSLLDGHDLFEKDHSNSSPFKWVGHLIDVDCPVEIVLISEPLGNSLMKLTSGTGYLTSLDVTVKASSEKEFYDLQNKQFVPAEMRELKNVSCINSPGFTLEKVIQATDIKGCLHNHSVYSDGQNTIAEMAGACKQLGLSYFGISDHSKTAQYAGGLYENDVLRQHKEIDEWNSRSPSFKIFKGIESDILTDGSLDYEEDVLKSFDFIVASVHSNLNMDKQTATARLIKAIENPFTTILGHASGRLLLRRKGYEIDHSKIIDACVQNKVVVEINANPWRLDMDWNHVRECADKGVLVSINPDAHEVDGIHDMQFGLMVARKACLYPEQVLNCLSMHEISAYFNQ